MAESCCGSCEVAAGEHGLQRRVLIAVLVVNAVMFAAELGAGLWAHSSALQADSIDMLIDAIGFDASLFGLNRTAHARASAGFRTPSWSSSLPAGS